MKQLKVLLADCVNIKCLHCTGHSLCESTSHLTLVVASWGGGVKSGGSSVSVCLIKAVPRRGEAIKCGMADSKNARWPMSFGSAHSAGLTIPMVSNGSASGVR